MQQRHRSSGACSNSRREAVRARLPGARRSPAQVLQRRAVPPHARVHSHDTVEGQLLAAHAREPDLWRAGRRSACVWVAARALPPADACVQQDGAASSPPAAAARRSGMHAGFQLGSRQQAGRQTQAQAATAARRRRRRSPARGSPPAASRCCGAARARSAARGGVCGPAERPSGAMQRRRRAGRDKPAHAPSPAAPACCPRWS